MKAPALLLTLLLSLSAPSLRAETDDLAEIFREALFEEEASRDFEKAIAAYEQVVAGYATQRQMAASALFRLAECHRKLDHKEEAAKFYRQLLGDFPAEETLAKLARENLVAMGEEAPGDGTATAMNEPGISAEEQTEIERVQRLLAESPDRVLGIHPADLNIATAKGYLKLATLLLDQGLDVNKIGNNGQFDGQFALGLAAQEGHLAMVDLLLERGADINLQPDKHNSATPLIGAIFSNRISVVERLLERKADPNLISAFNFSPLAAACERGNARIVARLLEAGAEVNASVREGETPLSLAIGSRASDVEPSNVLKAVQQLLDAGADVNASVREGETPLSLAIGSRASDVEPSNVLKAVQQLLDAGADPNGGDALHKAVEFSDSHHSERTLAVTELLLKAGADVNRKNDQGATPLLVALTGRNGKKNSSSLPGIELFTLLLDHGADPLLANDEGSTAVDAAIDRGALKVLNHFRERGVDLKSGVSTDLDSALVTACRHGNLELAKWLLGAGASPNAKVRTGSALYHAVGSGEPELVKLLLESKADPNGGGEENSSPLARAIWKIESRGKADGDAAQPDPGGSDINLTMLKLLLGAGADPNELLANGRSLLTALFDENAHVRTTEIVAALLDAGADPLIRDSNRKLPVELTGARNKPGFDLLWTATYYGDPTQAEGIWAAVPSKNFTKIFSAKRGGTSTLRLSDFLVATMANQNLHVPALTDPWTFRILRQATGETETVDMQAWAQGTADDPVLGWGDIVEMPSTGDTRRLTWGEVAPDEGDRRGVLVERLRRKITLQVHGKSLEYECVPRLYSADDPFHEPKIVRPFVEPTRREIMASTVEELIAGLRALDPSIPPRFRLENTEAGSSVSLDLSNSKGTAADLTPLLAGDTLILDAPSFDDPNLPDRFRDAITLSREEDGFLAVIQTDRYPVSFIDILAEAFRVHALSHPDLDRITIVRMPPLDAQAQLMASMTQAQVEAMGKFVPKPQPREFERLEVNLSELMVNEDAGKRKGPDLQPGDRIEIPARENPEGDWTGLSENVAAFLQEHTKASVTISVLGQADRKVLLAPTFPAYESQFGLATLKDVISPLGAAVDAGTCWLAPALSTLGYTNNKYELGKIEVVSQITDRGIDEEGRGVSATRSGSPRYFDLNATTPPVWLRAGDKIGFRAKEESPAPPRRRVVIPPGGGQ